MSIILHISTSCPQDLILYGISNEPYPRFSLKFSAEEIVSNLLPFAKSRLLTISEGIMVTNRYKRYITKQLLDHHFIVKWVPSPFLSVFAAGLQTGLVVDTISKAIVPVYDWRVLGFNAVFDVESFSTAIKTCLEKCPIDTKSELANSILIVGEDVDTVALELELNGDADLGIENIELNSQGNSPQRREKRMKFKIIRTCYHPRLISWTGASLLSDVKGLSFGKDCRVIEDLDDWTRPKLEE